MPTNVKLPEIRKEAFTKARESLGLTTKELSGMACLSVRQIEQIENGESSSYYGAQVKVTAAKKVAGLLKLKPEDAFDFGGLFPPQTTAAEMPAEQVTKVAETTKSTLQPKQSKTVNVQKFVVDRGFNKAKTPTSSSKKLFLLLSVAAAGVFAVINLRPLFFPEPVKEEVVVVEEVMVEAVPPNTPSTPENAQDIKPGSPVAVAGTMPSVVASASQTPSTECPSADLSVASYKSEAPKKAGDMVYLQSKTTQTVCVIDATGKTQNKTLEPGVGVNIYGKPPFKILTSGLNQVDLYFQGTKVRTGNAGGKTIILEATELSQSVPATDSQRN